MKMLNVDKISKFFKVLSDPNRIAMLNHLCGCRDANVSDLSKCCSIDISVVSRHLSKLKELGILGAKKNGKEVIYDLKARELATFLRELADEIETASNCCVQGEQND